MRLMHLSDLHLGKTVNNYPMLDDQKYILIKILNIIDEQKPDAVMIAGDVYDKSAPSAQAVEVFDDFLTRLSERGLKVFVISGNHDSNERMAFGAKIMDKSGVFMGPVYKGSVEPVTLADEYGEINFYMLPFLKPAHVRKAYPESEIKDHDQAIRLVIEDMAVDTNARNVLIAHQFVTGSERSDSEELAVGGAENIGADAFCAFDYVALGHLHRPQSCGTHTIRYSGTPLKYSFSEVNDNKSVTIIDIKDKGQTEISLIPLKPMREMSELKGTYDEIMALKTYRDTSYPDDYMHIILTDETDVPDALSKLRKVYKNLMKLDYDNARTRAIAESEAPGEAGCKPPLEYFSDFFESRQHKAMTPEQTGLVADLIEQIWEGRE